MNAVLVQPRPAALPRPLKLAIGASLAVHALALLWQHGGLPRLDTNTPRPLQVVLRSATPISEPSAEPVSKAHLAPAIAPRAPVAAPSPRAKPLETPRPTPILTRPASTAATTLRAQTTQTAPTASETPEPAVAQTAAEPAPRAPTPALAAARVEAAPTPPAADEAPDPAQLERYGRSLSSLLARQQNYPRLAAMRGWEGEVQLRVTIARRGNIVATQIVRSSGFEVLDQNAVQLVAAAAPLPRPPEQLQNRDIQVIVPVHYKLEKSS